MTLPVMCSRCPHHINGHTPPSTGDSMSRLLQELMSIDWQASHGAWVPPEEPCLVADCTCSGFVLDGTALIGSYVHVGMGMGSFVGDGFEVVRFDQGGMPRTCQDCREPIPPESGRFIVQCMSMDGGYEEADDVPTFVRVNVCVGCTITWALDGAAIRDDLSDL